MRVTVNSNEAVSLSLCEDDTEKSIAQNLAIILSTKVGTVPMYRSFGLPMAFIDRPPAVAEALLAAEVREAIEEFEPRAEYVGLSLEANPDKPGEVIVILEVEI